MIASIILLLFQSGDGAGGIFCMGVGIFIVIVALVAGTTSQSKKKEIENARLSYNRALQILKSNPANPNFKQKTLELGRVYSNLTRDKKGVTIFDEMALMNDINAVCAGAMVAQVQVNQPIKPLLNKSVEFRLEQLKGLKDKGLIDGAEYASKRQNILDEV